MEEEEEEEEEVKKITNLFVFNNTIGGPRAPSCTTTREGDCAEMLANRMENHIHDHPHYSYSMIL